MQYAPTTNRCLTPEVNVGFAYARQASDLAGCTGYPMWEESVKNKKISDSNVFFCFRFRSTYRVGQKAQS
ncbi:hypothetical protein [Dysgonomonas alginatilytica]|uniref:hypothetical protein n=1 Tax=Dysgonomonas alginatilytica TaxID=1605892 RepID=UPI001473013D|nr:hypothetical protein [Dysgonomonas alginatilytica]